MGGFIDDGFHAHPKREIGGCPADGLLARAISYAGDNKTDGWVPASWVEKQFPRRQRRLVLTAALDARLLEAFPAGSAREHHGPRKQGLRTTPVTVVVGPHAVDGYVIHDYLHSNRAGIEIDAKRTRDVQRKRHQRAKPSLWSGDVPRDVTRESRLRRDSGVGVGGTTESSNGPTPEILATANAVLERLYAVERFRANANEVEDPIRVVNFMSMYATADPLLCADTAAQWGRGSGWGIDDGVVTFSIALRGEVERAAAKADAAEAVPDFSRFDRVMQR